ncbi:E3 ubiquitin-protein ligase RNF25 isoform X2 [Neltuma alba]|uniref:E3 ubiquitin-protein ligase RNF25 isoform X2 n=1 Tax=Neltuma alba TaxID=207710 RepID=UPI0010A3E4CF|nr:E3 ubiquitin-protein ligase RNF25 isoform X2 [Prosopis alba]
MAADEVLAEVEAVEAVYGSDCVVIGSFPPHLHIFLKPRTADVSSEQFVEAIIKIQASPQYPNEPPCIYLVDCKGLDEQRQKELMNYIRDKAHELSPCLMLVALCEEAVEKLSAMNHPDGDCPLCLYPLVPEDLQNKSSPFMKLMSCFHCFHRECIARWWNWLQSLRETESSNSAAATACFTHHTETEKDEKKDKNVGNCPVCRMPFYAKDLEHVVDLIDSHVSQLSLDRKEADVDDSILHCEHEISRREKFEAILKIQEENSGIIEPKRDIAVLPGMFLPRQVANPGHEYTEESTEQQEKDAAAVVSENHASRNSSGPSSSRNRAKHEGKGDHHSQSYNSTARNPRKAVQHWVRKYNDNDKQRR